jgi:U3 small nucleolar RNA-associated protein 12
VVLFNLNNRTIDCMFTSHKTAVQAMKFDSQGLKIITGGLDTDCVVSDVVDQIGKQRLTGHSGPITSCQFIEKYKDVAVSSSKDMQIKFWNVETQFCFKTIVDNHAEVWGVSLLRDDSFLVSGSKENALRVYKLTENKSQTETTLDINTMFSDDDSASPLKCNFVGSIQRSGKGRTVNLLTDKDTRVLACNGTDDEIELFYFCSADESMERLTKRLKKLSVKKISEGGKELSLADEIRRIASIKTKEKVKSLDLLLSAGNELRVGIVFANNLIRLYTLLDINHKHPEAQLIRAISQQGHHTEVRSICFSSDNLAVASGSGDELKLWNRSSLACLRTVETEYILSSCFVPGDRHVLLGAKSGNLIIVDIVIGEIVETIPAHEKELWSVSLLPDMRGCVTGGGDSTVKFWSFELITDPINESNKVLSLIHKNTLQLEENVLAVRITPNGKYIACALLNSTVTIFFLDSFKFFLSLYGHKLPVLCMDVSYDDAIIVTGSADRNVKIWGMDFGDCHRSLFAHDDSVMGIQFIPKTHMFFTCGKDGKIKQWDGDSFVKILTLPGHVGEAYNLCVSPNGRYLVSCGSDRTIRMYERTNEPLVLQDEQEEERERAENQTLATGEETTAPGLPGLNLPSRKTVDAEKAAENILECLELSKKFDDDKSIEIPPLMAFYEANNTDDFLLGVLSKVRASDLEEALLLLPFPVICEILEKLPRLASSRLDQTELICKVTLFLFRIHHKLIVTNQILLPSIQKLIKVMEGSVVELRDMIGSNVHSMALLQRRIEDQDKVELFKDATRARKVKEKRQRKRQIAKRVHMQITA